MEQRSDGFHSKPPSLQMNFNSDRPSLMSQLKKNGGINLSTPTTSSIPGNGFIHHHNVGSGESPFPNYREINLTTQTASSGKRNAQSVEGKASETQDVYMSLDRKSAKKQFIELSSNSGKRENNFSKIPA